MTPAFGGLGSGVGRSSKMTRSGSGADEAPEMARPVRRIRLGKQGRLVVPAELRERLGAREGDAFEVQERDGELVLRLERQRSKAELWEHIRELWRLGDGGSSEDLLRDRRAEVERESA